MSARSLCTSVNAPMKLSACSLFDFSASVRAPVYPSESSLLTSVKAPVNLSASLTLSLWTLHCSFVKIGVACCMLMCVCVLYQLAVCPYSMCLHCVFEDFVCLHALCICVHSVPELMFCLNFHCVPEYLACMCCVPACIACWHALYSVINCLSASILCACISYSLKLDKAIVNVCSECNIQVLKTFMITMTDIGRCFLAKYKIQNTVNPKPEELESWNFERMFMPHSVSCGMCHVSKSFFYI